MITNHKSWLFAALFVLAGLFSAQAQSVVHNKAYFDGMTYQWTDASGVSHENSITEVATDPYQIVALLKKIYCDPNIPGPKFSAYDKNGAREDSVYYGAVGGGWNISASDVTAPYEEGYTLLMVALNNHITPRPYQSTSDSNHFLTYFTQTSELIDYIRTNVASVQMLCDGLRLGSGENAGTAFNISGEYNRFFILGKGQARKKDTYVTDYEDDYNRLAGERVPFKAMFEQFSPTDGSPGSEAKDFYARMVIKGELFPVVHDCMSVIENEHDFSMAGKDQEEYKSLTGMNIFIPDYRLKYWEDDITWTTYEWLIIPVEHQGKVDGRTMNPYQTVDGQDVSSPSYACAHYAQYDSIHGHRPYMGIYTIKLNADAEQAAAEHTYDVVLDWTSSLNTLAGGEEVPQTYTVYIVDEYGYNTELVVTDQTTYTYTVPQEEHSYTLTYVVYGMPSGGDHDMFVAWSNTDDVIIPGWNDFLALGIDHYESDYVIESELNYYRNFFNLTNLDELNAFTTARVAAGENQFVLYRYDMSVPNVMTKVATVDLNVVNNGVRYNVEYQDQDKRPNYDIEVKTSDVLDVNNGVIDLSGLKLVDQFSADVSENEHPERYGYVLSLGELSDDAKTTNSVEIPVIKNYGMNLGYYTEEQIQNDKNAELTAGVKNADVMYELYNAQEIYYVDLLRGNNAAPSEEISHLQRRTDGSFFEFSNVLPQYAGSIEWYWADRFDTNVVTGNYNDYMTYVPITWTFGEDRVKKDGENSYGGEIYKNYVADVDVEVTGTVSDHGTFANWLDENEEECAIFNPVITVDANMPTLGNWEYKPAMYRVWLKCDNRRGYTKNPKNGHSVNDPTAELSNFDLIVEDNVAGETHEVYGNANTDELAFGATFASRNGGISFLVRMYYEVDASLGMRALPAGMPAYYVVEKEVPWSNMPTGIYEISSSNEVAKTYYNAQGLSSDKPFDGVNIVVTRYSDGSTKTDKFVR
jgi:hypothetical protein